MAGTVLVVDPSDGGRDPLGPLLLSRGYDVLRVDGLPAARRAAQSRPPDAVLIAIGTGAPEGAGLAAAIASDPVFSRCGVIAVAADASPDLRRDLLRGGVIDVIEAPIDARFLAARLRALSRPRSVADELALREETTRALGLADAPLLVPTVPGRIAIRARDPAEASRMVSTLSAHLSDKVYPEEGSEAGAADVCLLVVGAEDDPDAIAALRARLQETRLLAVLPDGHGPLAANALDLGADDVAGIGDDPVEIAMRLRTLVRLAQDRARCKMRLADGLDLAHRDTLTGLWNRRYAEPHLALLAEAAAASRRPLAVLMLDIDRFKAVNDRHGHPVGDAVLREVAARLERSLRVADLLARFGGEEFLIVLPDTGPAQARAAARRVCAAVGDRPIILPDGTGLKVTVSAGLAHSRPGRAAGPVAPERLVAAADRALYRAKSSGRDRVAEAA